MAQYTSYQKVDLSAYAAGGTIQLTLATGNYFVLYNNVTLGGGLTITDDGTPVEGNLFMVRFDGTITTGASPVSFFGQTVAEPYLQDGMFAMAYYDGSAYQVSIMPSFLANEFIVAANIKDNTISLAKLVTGTSGFVVMYNGSGVATATAISGDITVSATGVTAIGAAKVVAGMIASNAVRTASIQDGNVTLAKLSSDLQAYFATSNTLIAAAVTIPTAEVLTAFTTPVVLVGAVAGKTIKPVGDIYQSMDYLGVPYTTNGITRVYHNGASINIATATANGFLFGTVDREVRMTPVYATGATDTQYLVNADLLWSVASADPAAGTADVTVSFTYQLV